MTLRPLSRARQNRRSVAELRTLVLHMRRFPAFEKCRSGNTFLTDSCALPAPQPPQGKFLDFYNGVNGHWRLGGPISAELTEPINGVPTRVQYFEKGRLELNPSTQTIALGSLGRLALDARCAKAA